MLSACSTESAERDGAALEAGGSCDGYCGGEAPSGCFCDEECGANGDCCSDAEQFCTILAVEDCDGDHDGEGDSGGGGDNEICYLGPNRDGTVCFPLATPGNPSGYNYPAPLNGNYRKPIAYLDLDAVDLDTKIAPNFSLGEIAQRHKGRYAVVQPHAIAALQAMRDTAGGLRINSGYRNVTYNRSIGGATKSRHMYGDAFDIGPSSVSINNLEGVCRDKGGKLVEYNSHVHCDWRFDPQDTKFFGAASSSAAGPQSFEIGFSAVIVQDGDVFTAPAQGFDEGEPSRRWQALDGEDEVLAAYHGEVFMAPTGTRLVRVEVGRVIEAELALE